MKALIVFVVSVIFFSSLVPLGFASIEKETDDPVVIFIYNCDYYMSIIKNQYEPGILAIMDDIEKIRIMDEKMEEDAFLRVALPHRVKFEMAYDVDIEFAIEYCEDNLD